MLPGERPNRGFGQTDVEYYVATARRMRSEWFARQIGKIARRLAEATRKPRFRYGGPAVNR